MFPRIFTGHTDSRFIHQINLAFLAYILTVRKIVPTPVSCTVCPNLCFILSHTPQFEGKRNRYQMWQVYVSFPWYLTVHFALEGLEHLSKVSGLCSWGTYPCGMSVSSHSAQAGPRDLHITAVVDRLLGLTVNMFEKLSSWAKKLEGERGSLLAFVTAC